MKIREFRKLLPEPETKWIIKNEMDLFLHIGSPLSPRQVIYDVETKVLGLGITHNTPESLNEELQVIYKIIEGLIACGNIKKYITGKDKIPRKDQVKVYWYDEGKIYESVTEKIGYPGLTAEGYLMYENTHFGTRLEAIIYALADAESYLKMLKRTRDDYQQRLTENGQVIREQEIYHEYLTELKKEVENEQN